MKLQIHKKISTYAKSILFISSIFMAFSSANAELVTFKFEGVITQVGSVSTAAINHSDAIVNGSAISRITHDDIDDYDELTGYEPGDKFTGKYTFDTETPLSGDESSLPDLVVYTEAIHRMSFVSGKNTLTAEQGTIVYDDTEVVFHHLNSVDFSPLVAGGGILNNPSATPRNLSIQWLVARRSLPPPVAPDSNLGFVAPDGNLSFVAPSVSGNPRFDTNQLAIVDGGHPVYFGPIYGSISISFNVNSTIESVQGVIHSIEAVPTDPPTDTNLVAHWPLNDGTGAIAQDISGNNNHGTLTDPTRWGTFSNDPTWGDSTVLDFNGNDNLVNMGSIDVSGEALSLTARVESPELDNCNSHDCRIISKAMGVTEQDHYWMLSTIKVGNETRLRFRLKTNGETSTLIASSGNLTNSEAFYAAATYDGTTMRLYKNGVEVGNLPKTGDIDTNNTAQVWIGDNPDVAGSRPWEGVISDVRVYKKALTTTEIETIAN